MKLFILKQTGFYKTHRDPFTNGEVTKKTTKFNGSLNLFNSLYLILQMLDVVKTKMKQSTEYFYYMLCVAVVLVVHEFLYRSKCHYGFDGLENKFNSVNE